MLLRRIRVSFVRPVPAAVRFPSPVAVGVAARVSVAFPYRQMSAAAAAVSPKKRKAESEGSKTGESTTAASSVDNKTIALYSYWRSSSAWRVRIALAHKELKYEYRAINLLQKESRSEEYVKLNPMQQIPLLVIDGHSLAQSVAICEYLDETRPAHPLYPSDKFLRAKTRELCEIVNSGIQPLQNMTPITIIKTKLGEAEMNAWVGQFIRDGLKAFQTVATPIAGTYCVGDTVTAADMYLIPQLANARRFNVDLTPYPLLTRIESAVSKLPAFIAAHMDNQPDKPPATTAAAAPAAAAAAPAK